MYETVCATCVIEKRKGRKGKRGGVFWWLAVCLRLVPDNHFPGVDPASHLTREKGGKKSRGLVGVVHIRVCVVHTSSPYCIQ
jgi:hypothetical protein